MKASVYKLIAGFQRFHDKYFSDAAGKESLYHALATSGQTPKTLLIGCSDSRVDPALLTDAGPGEIFVVRNVANLVPPCEPSAVGFHGTSSAIEFAVINLKVENIIVLGHRQCGGIQALMKGATNNNESNNKSFVAQWMSIANEARAKTIENFPKADEETLWKKAEMESIKVSIKNLNSFPFVQEAKANRKLEVFGFYFNLESGELWSLNELTNEFELLRTKA